MNWVSLVRNYCPSDKAIRWNSARFVVGTLHILYFSLNEPAPGEPDIGDDEWDTMRKRHLFTMDEIQMMKDYKGYKPFLPLIWAMQEVEAALKTDFPGAPKGPELAALIGAFRGIAFEMRGHCGQINNWLKQPVPFPYFQFLTILLVVDLVLIAYGLLNMEFNAFLTLIIYLVILSSFIGLKEVAVAMSDPFGEDDIDFNTNGMLTTAYNNSVAMLQNERPVALDKLGDLGNPIIKGPAPPPKPSNGVSGVVVQIVHKVKVPEGFPPGMGRGSKGEMLL